jgi:hypothetical protein
LTTIQPGHELAAILRQQVEAFRPRSAGNGAAAAAQAQQAPDLASVVAQRIQGIQRDDPQRRQKAVRIFLESVLLHELGSTLVQDPAFPEMVDAVQQQMQDDGKLAAAMNQLGELLLKG